MKKLRIILISFVLMMNMVTPINTLAENEKTSDVEITAQSAVLMEPISGKVLYEKNPHEKLRPASVTKIMTILLIFDALESGKIKLDDEVVVSEYAASMGGSQVFLEPNEVQTVDTMIKCIATASANDAAVAMAEFIGGSEEGFANMMNERAKGLGMKDTHFVNCNGLDNDAHLTSAYDIALMSRELTTKYPKIFDYTTVWMDNIIHKTKKGEEEFGLTNTNKLLKWYQGATGLKTGSTSLAKYCLSGTAERNGLKLIAVVMAAPDYKTRFKEVMKLFDYGFANCSVYIDEIKDKTIQDIPVVKGKVDSIECKVNDNFSYVFTKNTDKKEVTKDIVISEYITAPIKKGDKVGEIIYKIDNEEVGKVDVVSNQDVEKADFGYDLNKVLEMMFK